MRYKRYKEGNAIKSRMTMGTTVHTVSRRWESIVYLSTNGVAIIARKR